MDALIWPAVFVILILASGACILTAAIILGVALGEWARDRLFHRSRVAPVDVPPSITVPPEADPRYNRWFRSAPTMVIPPYPAE